MKIGIDVDGVLADFNTAFIERVIAVTGRDLFPPRPFEIPTWNYPEYYGYTNAEIKATWATIKDDAEFWYNLRAYPDVPEFLAQLDSNVHDIYFITNRMGTLVKAQTESWLEFHSFGLHSSAFSFPTVLITDNKGGAAHALKLDFYIDDKTENCLAVNHDSPMTRVCMLARPWNTLQVGIPRIADLQTFQKLIQLHQ